MAPMSHNLSIVAKNTQWIQHSHSHGQYKGRQQVGGCTKKLVWIDEIKQIGFQVMAKCNNVFSCMLI